MQAVQAGTDGPKVAEASPRSPVDPEEGRQEAAVEAYARDHEGLKAEHERDALDYLLAPKAPRWYGVTVQYDTEDGLVPLTFVIRGQDGRKLDAIELECTSDTTGRLDQITADLRLVVLATAYLEGKTGRQTKLASEEFRTVTIPKRGGEEGEFETKVLASPVDALEARFSTQLGLVSGVARQVRMISGYDAERVGSANRRLVVAVGNS